jgi:hypothetical protein
MRTKLDRLRWRQIDISRNIIIFYHWLPINRRVVIYRGRKFSYGTYIKLPKLLSRSLIFNNTRYKVSRVAVLNGYLVNESRRVYYFRLGNIGVIMIVRSLMGMSVTI